MAFDIREIQTQLEAAPIVSPYSHDLALAIICDTFRLAKVRPHPARTGAPWRTRPAPRCGGSRW